MGKRVTRKTTVQNYKINLGTIRVSNQKGRGKEKLKGNCNHCEKPGHEEANCWEKHPEKKPAKYKKGNDTRITNVDILATNIEVMERKAKFIRLTTA